MTQQPLPKSHVVLSFIGSSWIALSKLQKYTWQPTKSQPATAVLPTGARKSLSYLNCAKEKSDASTAALPSRPLMPTPMCAALIMPTSFAPSPIPSVIAPAFFFTISVICDTQCVKQGEMISLVLCLNTNRAACVLHRPVERARARKQRTTPSSQLCKQPEAGHTPQ